MTIPDRYGVIGYPVSHSRSPVIHRLFALQTGENIQYELLQVTPEKLEAAVRQFQRTGGKGLNVTVPPWVQDGGFEASLERMRDPATRERIIELPRFVASGRVHGHDRIYCRAATIVRLDTR